MNPETSNPIPPANGAVPRVAVLGIGMMGLPMARRLLDAGLPVTAWNRARSKAERLEPAGGRVADTPAEAVAGADVVITLLTDGQAVEDVLFRQGAAEAMRAGSTLIDMSSIQPRQARDHAARLAGRGVHHLDAPVSGGTVGAEAGTLAIMVGGRQAQFEQAFSVFEVLGRATHVGPHGAGQLAKLANQMIVGVTIGAVAEALLLCERGGADMARVREAISGGFADSRILQVHGQRMIERDFTKRGAVSVQLKDMRNALATASEIGFEAPITALFERLYAEAADHGLADLDHSALFVELASRNGMN
ncbi:MAG TPA: NAD(P)-dependent oxidoreductase [Hydrogenophaga sp.]|uniref:NAD(P)-dependent oxidoreductase n=1 Tax=Hydrogenophaga sp. TaxID=1904254 RepID=UPI002BCBB0F3|nr:NAD(P)-dependent oxidoreductase [Hydrogenophaga sp.]HMN93116.1 NAD(P)-dependent oxidoreductase [Hydrogenophaga sp.]HMP10926.1 NAD(P)-dependent oxidoreductase [Hydrogenophaga sp.]